MTVGELIEKLKEMPNDMLVLCGNSQENLRDPRPHIDDLHRLIDDDDYWLPEYIEAGTAVIL